MFKTKKDNTNNRQNHHDWGESQKITNKDNIILRLFQLGKSLKVENKTLTSKFKNGSQKNPISDGFCNDIFISNSGQVKIDNLDSCLNLVSSDFIVF